MVAADTPTRSRPGLKQFWTRALRSGSRSLSQDSAFSTFTKSSKVTTPTSPGHPQSPPFPPSPHFLEPVTLGPSCLHRTGSGSQTKRINSFVLRTCLGIGRQASSPFHRGSQYKETTVSQCVGIVAFSLFTIVSSCSIYGGASSPAAGSATEASEGRDCMC